MLAVGRDDRRIHARIETDLVCTVLAKDGPRSARIRDLSHGGAQLVGEAGMADLGESLAIEVELPDQDEPIAILGEVCRGVGEGEQVRYGIRFAVVEPRQHETLARFIDQLADGQGVGQRQHPRVYRRVGVICRTRSQSEAVMHNISQGGLALQCGVPLVLDEEVTVEIRFEPFPEPLELHGRVVHVRTLEAGQYQVGVRFEQLESRRAKALAELIRFLLRTPG
jgi:c-di-GMP-binding flagellar brake protein YcgR